MKRFVLTPSAEVDLTQIGQFVSRSNPAAAVRVLREIRTAIRKLALHPGLGHKREDLTEMPILFYAVYSYLIVYRPDIKPLRVLRILHGARDVQSILETDASPW